MRVLAIDTALSACSVAVLDTADAGGRGHVVSLAMERGHAEALMPEVARVVEAAGGFGALDRVAVSVGPGSFTGLRVGLACARAIGVGTGLKVVGVTSLTALAAPVLLTAGGALPVAAAIDARHGRVFFELFSAGGVSLVPATLIDAAEAARAIGEAGALVVGSGAELVIAAAARDAVRKADARHAAPDPIWVARLGALCDPASAAPKPLYLKAADAQPQQRGVVARA